MFGDKRDFILVVLKGTSFGPGSNDSRAMLHSLHQQAI